jgi:hypothetical protein
MYAWMQNIQIATAVSGVVATALALMAIPLLYRDRLRELSKLENPDDWHGARDLTESLSSLFDLKDSLAREERVVSDMRYRLNELRRLINYDPEEAVAQADAGLMAILSELEQQRTAANHITGLLEKHVERQGLLGTVRS